MNLTEWIGKSETIADTATATPYAALSATLDRTPERPPAETPLPALWHWLYFLPLARQSEIGPDGHPKRGGFLPPVPLPRRMWAGSRMEFFRPLRVGDAIRRESRIAAVNVKEGRSGMLVFVTVRHEIACGDMQLLIDEHDIVYRDLDKGGPAPSPKMALSLPPPPRNVSCSDEPLKVSLPSPASTTMVVTAVPVRSLMVV